MSYIGIIVCEITEWNTKFVNGAIKIICRESRSCKMFKDIDLHLILYEAMKMIEISHIFTIDEIIACIKESIESKI